MWVGLLCLEMGLVFGFYILPQFQARHAPEGHWELETPLRGSPGVLVALVVLLTLLTLGNIGLIITIWRGFKDFRVSE